MSHIVTHTGNHERRRERWRQSAPLVKKPSLSRCHHQPAEDAYLEEVETDDSWYPDPTEALDGVTRPRGFVRSVMESWQQCAAGCGRGVDPDAPGTDLSSGHPVCSHCSLCDDFHFGLPDRRDD